MSEETGIGTQTLDCSSETIELRFRQEPKMNFSANETSADELTVRSVDERINQATDPVLRRIEKLCALLASRTEVESAGNSEASGSTRNHESISPSGHRYDNRMEIFRTFFPHLRLVIVILKIKCASVYFWCKKTYCNNRALFEKNADWIENCLYVDGFFWMGWFCFLVILM